MRGFCGNRAKRLTLSGHLASTSLVATLAREFAVPYQGLRAGPLAPRKDEKVEDDEMARANRIV